MVKKPEIDDMIGEPSITQRIIQIVSAVVIANKWIITHITLERRPNKGSSNLNMAQNNRDILPTIKLIDPPL